jgi:hypothetical protein
MTKISAATKCSGRRGIRLSAGRGLSVPAIAGAPCSSSAPRRCWCWRAFCWRALPESHPASRFTYPELLQSLAHLFRRFSQLREAALTGAMFFGAFSAFWATLIFRSTTSPFHYGARAAGLFGLIGAAGAAAASVVGRIATGAGPERLWRSLSGLLCSPICSSGQRALP